MAELREAHLRYLLAIYKLSKSTQTWGFKPWQWALFDKVQNCGGWVACQDDARTFSVMCSSQFRAWNRELLESCEEDL